VISRIGLLVSQSGREVIGMAAAEIVFAKLDMMDRTLRKTVQPGDKHPASA
jgi:hypothetical protein